MCVYVCINGSVSVQHECDVGFQKKESQPSRTIFTGAQLEIFFWQGHWVVSTWNMFKEEQLDMDRSLAAMSHVNQIKELGRFGPDKNKGEGGFWGNGEGWHCSLGKIMKASSRART